MFLPFNKWHYWMKGVLRMEKSIADFLSANNLKGVIAFSGGAGDDDTEDHHIKDIISEAIKFLAGRGFAIATNGTQWGVPYYTELFARDNGIPTVRVYPQKARSKNYLVKWPAGLDLCVDPRIGESEWGDDSEVFIKISSGIIFIKGGTGTQIEFAHWAKINESRISHGTKVIYGVPVCGVGGWSSWVYDCGMQLYKKIFSCFPQEKIFSGKDAVEFLLSHISC